MFYRNTQASQKMATFGISKLRKTAVVEFNSPPGKFLCFEDFSFKLPVVEFTHFTLVSSCFKYLQYTCNSYQNLVETF
jgi:hypothetical protein